jgi:hypothetical protein
MSARYAYYDRDADIAWLPTGDSDDVLSEDVGHTTQRRGLSDIPPGIFLYL